MPLFSSALDHSAAGPFAGVPFLIKDSGPIAAGVPFFCGSRSLGTGVIAGRDSDLMTRFRAVGLATLGLSTVPELAISFATESVKHGPTRNPWAPARGVGGSSGGAAALVAAGAVPLAHANDGAGSIRVPASCCGLVEEATPEIDWDAVIQTTEAGLIGIAAPFLAAPRPTDPDKVEAVSRHLLAHANTISGLDLIAALNAQNRVSRSVASPESEPLGAPGDALLLPDAGV